MIENCLSHIYPKYRGRESIRFLKNFMASVLMDGIQLFQSHRVTTRRQFAFYRLVPRNLWYSFDRSGKDERLSLWTIAS